MPQETSCPACRRLVMVERTAERTYIAEHYASRLDGTIDQKCPGSGTVHREVQEITASDVSNLSNILGNIK